MVRSDLAYPPVFGTTIHNNVEFFNSLINPENILTTDVESNFPCLGGSQPSDFNPHPHQSSLAQIRGIYPSVTPTNTNVDPPKCGGFHQMELVVTNL